MNQPVKYVNVNIRKPLYGNFCYIREKHVLAAIRRGAMLRVTTPNGIGVHDPSVWRRTGKKMLKEFKIPGRPMVLWGNEVKITKPLPKGRVVKPVEEKKPEQGALL